MAYYRCCPYCRAALDPGEQCDCKEKAAVDAANIHGGIAEQVQNHSEVILTNESGECQE